jgi:hypothetical protein
MEFGMILVILEGSEAHQDDRHTATKDLVGSTERTENLLAQRPPNSRNSGRKWQSKYWRID